MARCSRNARVRMKASADVSARKTFQTDSLGGSRGGATSRPVRKAVAAERLGSVANTGAIKIDVTGRPAKTQAAPRQQCILSPPPASCLSVWPRSAVAGMQPSGLSFAAEKAGPMPMPAAYATGPGARARNRAKATNSIRMGRIKGLDPMGTAGTTSMWFGNRLGQGAPHRPWQRMLSRFHQISKNKPEWSGL